MSASAMSARLGQGDAMLATAHGRAPLRVAVVYHAWPHYRQPVMQAMDRSRSVAYDFFGSGEPLEGVPHAETGAVARFVRAPFRRIGKLLWQPDAIRAARDTRYQAIILFADPNFASTWIAAALARLRGVPVLFWGHGWLRPENGGKRAVRRAYFGLAHRFLVYGERGKRLGVAAGHAPERITVVYNSLDVARADAVIAGIESGAMASVHPQAFFAEPARPLLICTARLTAKCRFDLLLAAAALLEREGLAVNVLLVGDGPERESLVRQAAELGVALHVFGSCHDEEIVGQLLYRADLTVSPGKIGLTAMHSLMYGTPAITHGDFDAQMPEVEAIEPGHTGAFFARDDAGDLAATIAQWLGSAPPRAHVRERSRAAIRAKWTPQAQARIIEATVLEVAGRA
jgi:glycosyltransferase involved in cell wall biosynthesis